MLFFGVGLFSGPVNEVRHTGHKQVWKDHQIHNTVVNTFSSRLTFFGFKHGTAHGTLRLHIIDEEQEQGNSK